MSPYSSVKCPRNQIDFMSYLQPSCAAKLVHPQRRFRLKKGVNISENQSGVSGFPHCFPRCFLMF